MNLLVTLQSSGINLLDLLARRRIRIRGGRGDVDFVSILLIAGALSFVIVGGVCLLFPRRTLGKDYSDDEDMWDFLLAFVGVFTRVFPDSIRLGATRFLGLFMLLGAGAMGFLFYEREMGENTDPQVAAIEAEYEALQSSIDEANSESSVQTTTGNTGNQIRTDPPTDPHKQAAVRQADGYIDQARQYWAAGDRQNSLQLAQKAYQVLQSTLGDNHQKTIEVRNMIQAAQGSSGG